MKLSICLACCLLVQIVRAGSESAQISQDEVARRQAAQLQARALIEDGAKLFTNGKLEEAVTKLEAAFKILPTPKDATRAATILSQAYTQLADQAGKKKKSEKAAEFADKAIEYTNFIQDIERLDKGLVKYNGEWMTPEDKANLEKGRIKYEGEWVTPAEKDRREQTAKGFVEYQGKWVAPEVKASLEKLEDERLQALAAERKALAEKKRVEKEEAAKNDAIERQRKEEAERQVIENKQKEEARRLAEEKGRQEEVARLQHQELDVLNNFFRSGNIAFSKGDYFEARSQYGKTIQIQNAEGKLPQSYRSDSEYTNLAAETHANVLKLIQWEREGVLYLVHDKYLRADFILPLEVSQKACATALKGWLDDKDKVWTKLGKESGAIAVRAADVGAGGISGDMTESMHDSYNVSMDYGTASASLGKGNYETLTIYPPTRFSAQGDATVVLVQVDFEQNRKVHLSRKFFVRFSCIQSSQGWQFLDATIDREERWGSGRW